jgi:hypothetical protein
MTFINFAGRLRNAKVRDYQKRNNIRAVRARPKRVVEVKPWLCGFMISLISDIARFFKESQNVT